MRSADKFVLDMDTSAGKRDKVTVSIIVDGSYGTATQTLERAATAAREVLIRLQETMTLENAPLFATGAHDAVDAVVVEPEQDGEPEPPQVDAGPKALPSGAGAKKRGKKGGKDAGLEA